MTESISWVPSAEVTRHNGEPIPADQEFFAEPSYVIGPVLTADSTLRNGQKPISVFRFVLNTAIVTALFVGPMSYAVGTGFDWCIASVLFPVVALPVYLCTRFYHVCSFVGECGVASYFRGRRKNACDVLITFDRATALYSTHVESQGRTAKLEWFSADHRLLFTLDTAYSHMDFTKKTRHQKELVAAAEGQWTAWVWERLKQTWNETQEVRLPLRSGGEIVLTPDAIRVVRPAGTENIPIAEIAAVTLNHGFFEIKTDSAKAFNLVKPVGRTSLKYADVGNAHCFLVAVRELYGDAT